MGEIGGVMSEEKKHRVYFATSRVKGKCMPTKIGYTCNPDERLKDLQVGNPNKLVMAMLLTCESEADGRKLERTLHFLARKRFQKLRGEWFLIKGSWKKLIEQALKMCRVELVSK